jgi:hypothetical protein
MTDSSMDRLIALVQRELKADSVRVLESGAEEADADNVLYAKLPDGRLLAVAFSGAPPSKDALVRRLRMLTATFAHSLSDGPRSSQRPPVSGLLHQELRALALRARALDAAVIDAQSPIVWGAGSAERDSVAPERIVLTDVSSARLVEPTEGASDSAPPDSGSGEGSESPPPSIGRVRELTEQAIDQVRDLPRLRGLRKGGHLAEVIRAPEFSALLRSFASIYVLVLVFDGSFDEVRAERAIEDALPRIERLVVALPPLDPKPSPIAGVVALRRGRRR